MKQNSSLEENRWYIHPGMLDTAIKIIYKSETNIVVEWFNISGRKRKFSLGFENFKPEVFYKSPFWEDQTAVIEAMPLELL